MRRKTVPESIANRSQKRAGEREEIVTRSAEWAHGKRRIRARCDISLFLAQFGHAQSMPSRPMARLEDTVLTSNHSKSSIPSARWRESDCHTPSATARANPRPRVENAPRAQVVKYQVQRC